MKTRSILFATTLLLGLTVAAADAAAVVGRPLTPMSYAGVARRTSRRTTRRAVAATAAVTASTPTPIYTLPPGCQQSGAVYVCGPTTYQPYYQGTTIAYVEQP